MKHYNPSITERANRIFNLKNGDGMSEEIDGPVAVIPVSPICQLVKNVTATTSGNTTIFTTSGSKDTYITAVHMSVNTDAANTGGGTRVTAVIQGVTVELCRIAKLSTGLAIQRDTSISFPFPVKLDRGTTVILAHDFGAGTANFAATVVGYEEEVTRT